MSYTGGMRPPGSPAELERRRHRAIALLDTGLMPHEVAKRVGVDRRSVRRWRAGHRRYGLPALSARPVPGRPWKLAAARRERLRQVLLKGAQVSGFPTALWTCTRVAQVIQRRFGVQYHPDHVGRLLHALGWSPQLPTRRAVERDERAIRHWIKHTWVEVKKKPAY